MRRALRGGPAAPSRRPQPMSGSKPPGSLMTVPSQSTVTSPSTEITWHVPSRVAFVRYSPGVVLTSKDARFLTDALMGWAGPGGEPFAVLADAAGLGGTDGEYRAEA